MKLTIAQPEEKKHILLHTGKDLRITVDSLSETMQAEDNRLTSPKF